MQWSKYNQAQSSHNVRIEGWVMIWLHSPAAKRGFIPNELRYLSGPLSFASSTLYNTTTAVLQTLEESAYAGTQAKMSRRWKGMDSNSWHLLTSWCLNLRLWKKCEVLSYESHLNLSTLGLREATQSASSRRRRIRWNGLGRCCPGQLTSHHAFAALQLGAFGIFWSIWAMPLTLVWAYYPNWSIGVSIMGHTCTIIPAELQ